jgi:hypothetical protein
MSTPRRRIVRPATPPDGEHRRRLQHEKLRTRLERERAALARWQTRLRRAFNAVEKHQRAVARLERQLLPTEGA